MSQARQKLLITGFDPFGGRSINPSWLAVQALPDQIGSFDLVKLQIPTIYGIAAQTVLHEAKMLSPSVILCIGQAAGRRSITPEFVGINLRHSSIADNRDFCPKDSPILPAGPTAYFTTLPVRSMTAAMSAKKIPSAVSYSAGTFVCNDVLYTLLHHYAGTDTKVGFIHVPLLPEQANTDEPSLPLHLICDGLRAAIEAIS